MAARRDAIARLLFYGLHSSRNEEAADAILALPIEQARDEVVEAARAWVERFTGMDSLTAQDSARLVDAVAELDALEAQHGQA